MLSSGWRLTATDPGALADVSGLAARESIEALVPGTVAGALRAAGDADWRTRELDARDWWFHTSFDSEPAGAGEEVRLCLDGLATLAEVYLGGELLHTSETMFRAFAIEIGEYLKPRNELAICFRALAPRLSERRKPRARWRTKLVSNGNLRFHRTMLLGRTPGFAPGPPVVGPWRPVRIERRRGPVAEHVAVRAAVREGRGIVTVAGNLRTVAAGPAADRVRLELSGPDGRHTSELSLRPGGPGRVTVGGELSIAAPARWWPHTHGQPALYDARLVVGTGPREDVVEAGRVGFRELHRPADLERDGLALRINGTPVFARGAVWTPRDLADPHASESELRRVLATVREAGFNMLRVGGIGGYESDAFYDLCDELGILVWQDFMFANLDYPESDPAFMAEVALEAGQQLERVAHRPSLTVLCGNSEVAQQVAMLGLDPGLATGALFGELLPALVRESGAEALYIPSTPYGGPLPFRLDQGVAHYFGVGAYLRGLEDARRAEVRFASECLAFSNVPDVEALAEIDAPGGLVPHHPAWKAGVPRDAGAGWDFEDVRDHYLGKLFDVDPVALRSTDVERYLELSRAVTGEVMAEVFGDWRREASPCAGGLVLWLTDLMPGAGWGLLDHRGEPKAAYHHLRRALAPVAVWGTDEGLDGITAHIANDRLAPWRGMLRVALYRDLEVPVGEASIDVDLPAHGARAHDVEALLGRFVDIGWTYRFGPPAQDVVVLSLAAADGELASQAFRFPVGRPTRRESAAQLGLSARLQSDGQDRAELRLATRRLAYGVRVSAPGFLADDDAFSVEPGHERSVVLRREPTAGRGGEGFPPPAASVTALNLWGHISASAPAG